MHGSSENQTHPASVSDQDRISFHGSIDRSVERGEEGALEIEKVGRGEEDAPSKAEARGEAAEAEGDGRHRGAEEAVSSTLCSRDDALMTRFASAGL